MRTDGFGNGAGEALVTPLASEDNTSTLAILEANHRIANSLASLAAWARLRGGEVTRRGEMLRPEEASALLVEVAARLETMGRLHKLMARQAGEGEVALAHVLNEVAEVTAAAFPQIALTQRLDGTCRILVERLAGVAMIVSELVVNAARHAAPATGAVAIEIRCVRGPDGYSVIEVEDNGRGLPDNFDPEHSSGLGSRIMRALAAQIRAVLSLKGSPNGTVATLALPA